MTITDMKTAVIYARVSSTGDRQSTERQVIDLTDYANKNGMTICKTFEEHISGAKKNHERPVLQECLTFCVDETRAYIVALMSVVVIYGFFLMLGSFKS